MTGHKPRRRQVVSGNAVGNSERGGVGGDFRGEVGAIVFQGWLQ